MDVRATQRSSSAVSRKMTMSGIFGLTCVIVFLVSLGLTALVRNIAIKRGMLDQPNERSSHVRPTPRGGGISIVIAATVGILVWRRAIGGDVLSVLVLGGLSIALVGFLDDRFSISALTRLGVHLLVAAGAQYALGGFPVLQIGSEQIHLGIWGAVLATIALVWSVNLFNFMDGIDALASSEVVFVVSAGAALSVQSLQSNVPVPALMVVAGTLGFLFWNWPPAKIFMGDAGSGYLGYAIAVLALVAARENGAMIFVWLILGGAFFVDATVTLVRRVLRGERPHVAHRSHAYQRLARKWGSHLRVTLVVGAVNVFWLLPIARQCLLHPNHALLFLVLALGPLVLVAWVAGAGEPEQSPSNSDPKST